MFQWLRNLRISLAAKCQILFGAAVVLIIGAALYVPWRRMDDLILMVNLQTAEGLASQAKLEHIAREQQMLKSRSIPQPAPVQGIPMLASGYFEPRLIPIHPPKSMPLGRFEIAALGYFWTHPAESHYARTYRLNDSERYRLAMPLYASDQPSCLECHAGGADQRIPP